MNYLQYDEKGRILCAGSAPDGADISGLGNTLVSNEPFFIDSQNYYVSEGALIERPVQPTLHHEWDWNTKQWIPNLDLAKSSMLSSVTTELNRRLYLPCNGFDADNVSRERISGMIARLQRGDGLPAGWVGWRDASNQQQWVTDDAATVLANLTALSRAIEDREQALLVAAWQHKAAVAELTSFDSIVSYDAAAHWPA